MCVCMYMCVRARACVCVHACVCVYTCMCVWFFDSLMYMHCTIRSDVFPIPRNFVDLFNLAIWRKIARPPNLIFANINFYARNVRAVQENSDVILPKSANRQIKKQPK